MFALTASNIEKIEIHICTYLVLKQKYASNLGIVGKGSPDPCIAYPLVMHSMR